MSTVPLGGVLGSLNHLIAAVLEEAAAHSGRLPLALDSVTVDETGCRIAGTLRTTHGPERFALRIEAAAPVGSRQTVSLRVEQWPAGLPPVAQWLKPLLDRARIAVDLDFGP